MVPNINQLKFFIRNLLLTNPRHIFVRNLTNRNGNRTKYRQESS